MKVRDRQSVDGGGGGGGRERERDRDRQTDRQTDRQRERERERSGCIVLTPGTVRFSTECDSTYLLPPS